MKKICFYTLYTAKGASSNYRAYIYREGLEANGYSVDYRNFWNDAYITKYSKNKKKYICILLFYYLKNYAIRFFQIVFLSNNYNIIVIQKEIIPYAPAIILKFLKVRNSSVKLIFDLDDAVFLDNRRKNHYKRIGELCDCIVVGNQNLAQFYKHINTNVYLIPTVDYTPAYKGFVSNTYDNYTVGWIGTKNTIENLEIVVKPFNDFAMDFPFVNFLIICDDDYGYVNKLHNCKYIKWDKHYIKHMSQISVGIMPLSETKYNEGKCGFKLIQYLNLHKPVIASKVGINEQIISGFGIACSNDCWKESFIQIFEKENYQNLEKSIQKDFESKFGYDINLHKLLDCIKFLEV